MNIHLCSQAAYAGVLLAISQILLYGKRQYGLDFGETEDRHGCNYEFAAFDEHKPAPQTTIGGCSLVPQAPC